jgi:hypothetical protein
MQKNDGCSILVADISLDVCRFLNQFRKRLKYKMSVNDSWKTSAGVVPEAAIMVCTPGLGVGFLGRLPEEYRALRKSLRNFRSAFLTM